MEMYKLKIYKNNPIGTKLINLDIQRLPQTYYEGVAYDLANILEDINDYHKQKNLIISIRNSKREPIAKEIRNGIGIFKNKNNLY